MDQTVISIAFIIVFVPGIFLFYYLLQCFDYEKLIKKGKASYFKALYMLVCIILSFLLASSITTLMEMVSNFITR